MNLKNVLFLILGLFIGWCTFPSLRADQFTDSSSYKWYLQRMISLMEDIKIADEKIAANTQAIKEKLGAK